MITELQYSNAHLIILTNGPGLPFSRPYLPGLERSNKEACYCRCLNKHRLSPGNPHAAIRRR